jgi:putative transposase
LGALGWLIWRCFSFAACLSYMPPRPTRLARWLAVLFGLLLILFVIGLVAVVGDSDPAYGVPRLFFGAPPLLSVVMALPVLMALAAAPMLVAGGLVWRERYWSLFGRVHYTLLTGMALATIWLFWYDLRWREFLRFAASCGTMQTWSGQQRAGMNSRYRVSENRKAMQLVEQHIIDKGDPRWSQIDAACLLSKNLYNAANYLVRQEYIGRGRYLPYAEVARQMKRQPDYCALPRKVSQWVLKQLAHDWKAFFAARDEWQRCPEKFLGRPQLPRYKDKSRGRNLLTYTAQAVSRRAFKQQGVIAPSQLGITIATRQQAFDQVRIVPRKTHYVVEVVYTVSCPPAPGEADRVAAIDMGVNNLAAVTFNQPGLCPLLVNGRPLKSINQYYNKERARLQSLLPPEQHHSSRLDILTEKRNRRVNAYLHLASRRIVELLQSQAIDTLVIGKNDGWKQEVKLGRRTNQSFVQIPHARFIQMLNYKAELAGIRVILTEESYTSKCSFLDGEAISKHEVYAGRRVKRGLFRAGDGRLIHADVNGSYNVMRKALPNALKPLVGADGIGASVVKPVRLRTLRV